MAGLNARLGFADDAGVCWMNALWLAEEALPAKALSWLRAEALAVPQRKEAGWPKGRTWVSPATQGPRGASIAGDDLDRLLKLTDPRPGDVRTLAAYVFCASCQRAPDHALMAHLGPVGQFLEMHAGLLPVRAAWLAALALHRLAGGDALGLARARDRLLERLLPERPAGRTGLAELPALQRPGGIAARPGRAPVAGRPADQARDWAERNRSHPTQTEAYIDLFFSFGLARLSELEASNRLLQRATAALDGQGQAHEFLLNAYAHRIRQAQQGETHPGPLPNEYMETLMDIERQRKASGNREGVSDSYIIDRLRQQSRILEPEQKIKPYRNMLKTQEEGGADPQGPARHPRPRACRRTWCGAPAQSAAGGRRVSWCGRTSSLRGPGPGAARSARSSPARLLPQVPELLDVLPLPRQADEFERQANLLEKALFVAAHFDCKDAVPGLVTRFERLLQSQQEAPTLQALDTLAAQCFRGLRKLGMQQEIRQAAAAAGRGDAAAAGTSGP